MASETRKLVIPNPITIPFDPFFCEDDYKNEGGVRIGTIFRDNVARVYWLTYKTFYLTSQNFRPAVMQATYWTRKNPPKTGNGNLPVGNFSDSFLWDSSSYREAVFPFIVFALMQENLWPYFVPAGVRELKYVIDTVPKVRRRQTAARSVINGSARSAEASGC